MKKFIFIFVILILLSGSIFLIYKYQRTNRVCFKNNCFEVELAITQEEQVLGLMFRESLGRNKGMLFFFDEEGEHSFWMKDTLIPLDIIWINQNGEVVFISENIQPCKENACPVVSNGKKAKYVLEINAGISREIDLKVGDKLEINLAK